VIPKITPPHGGSRGVGVGLLLVVCYLLPCRAESQQPVCPAVHTFHMMGGPSTQTVYKVVLFAEAGICGLVGMMGAHVSCSPSGHFDNIVTTVTAMARINNYPSSCSWLCHALLGPFSCLVSISSSDGLPVELLDFKVTSGPKPLSPPAATGKTAPTPSPRSDSSRLALIPAVR